MHSFVNQPKQLVHRCDAVAPYVMQLYPCNIHIPSCKPTNLRYACQASKQAIHVKDPTRNTHPCLNGNAPGLGAPTCRFAPLCHCLSVAAPLSRWSLLPSPASGAQGIWLTSAYCRAATPRVPASAGVDARHEPRAPAVRPGGVARVVRRRVALSHVVVAGGSGASA